MAGVGRKSDFGKPEFTDEEVENRLDTVDPFVDENLSYAENVQRLVSCGLSEEMAAKCVDMIIIRRNKEPGPAGADIEGANGLPRGDRRPGVLQDGRRELPAGRAKRTRKRRRNKNFLILEIDGLDGAVLHDLPYLVGELHAHVADDDREHDGDPQALERLQWYWTCG